MKFKRKNKAVIIEGGIVSFFALIIAIASLSVLGFLAIVRFVVIIW